MGEIAKQMLAKLPAEYVRTGAQVARIEGTEIQLTTGEMLNPEAVVVATGEMRNSGGEFAGNGSHWRGATCLYFAAEKAPMQESMLVLNGQGYGPVNHLAVMSNISPGYAPAGASLISANIVGITIQNDVVLENQVRSQLTQWFGTQVTHWRLLRIYRIPHALPETESAQPRPVRVRDGVYVCGDHRGNPSIQGALESGRRAAEALAEDAGVRAA